MRRTARCRNPEARAAHDLRRERRADERRARRVSLLDWGRRDSQPELDELPLGGTLDSPMLQLAAPSMRPGAER